MAGVDSGMATRPPILADLASAIRASAAQYGWPGTTSRITEERPWREALDHLLGSLGSMPAHELGRIEPPVDLEPADIARQLADNPFEAISESTIVHLTYNDRPTDVVMVLSATLPMTQSGYRSSCGARRNPNGWWRRW